MPDLDPSTEYILVQTPHRGTIFTCSGIPEEIIDIITANGRTSIEHYHAENDWSSYGDGEQPEWFKGEGWYYRHAHSEDPEGPATCHQAITEIAGWDHSSAVILTREETAEFIRSNNTTGHMGVERLFAIRSLAESLGWHDVKVEVTYDDDDADAGCWSASFFDYRSITSAIEDEYTGEIRTPHVHLFDSGGMDLGDTPPLSGRFRISRS